LFEVTHFVSVLVTYPVCKLPNKGKSLATALSSTYYSPFSLVNLKFTLVTIEVIWSCATVT